MLVGLPDGTRDADIWPVGAWAEALPKGGGCAERLKSQEGLIFVLFLFFIPSYCEWWQGSAREPGRAEVLQQCFSRVGFGPGEKGRCAGPFSSITGKQIRAPWRVQPASSQPARPREKGEVPLPLLQIISTTPMRVCLTHTGQVADTPAE